MPVPVVPMIRLAQILASAKVTLGWLGVAVVVLVLCRMIGEPPGRWMAVPLAGLCVGLAAAVVVTARLREDLGLFVFHVGLALLVGLAALGRLLAFDGHVEVTEGATLDPALVVGVGGPLHRPHFDDAMFVQGPFTIDYAPGMTRRETRSQVSVPDGAGGFSSRTVGDDRPLVLGGYRFYTSHNKGYAPLLTWTAGGRDVSGAVHLPSYPVNDFRQGTQWRPPDGAAEVTLWLSLPGPIYDEDGRWSFHTPEGIRLVVIRDGQRHELAPGEEVALDGGRLRFERLGTWMGYTIFYDPTLPWLVAASLLAILGLGLYAVSRVRGIANLAGETA
ncbi:MAG: cytochrome c biogenesis protein ResB [Alphaproteobacteria bacterium]